MATQKNEILHPAPVNYPILDKTDEYLAAPAWQAFFTNLNAAFNQFFVTVMANGAQGIEQLSIPCAPSLTTTERDSLTNVPNGASIYNTTTNKFNFRENGAWKEIP